MIRISPCQGIVPVLSLVLLACDAYSQSTAYPQATQQYSEIPAQAPYTVPIDPSNSQRVTTAGAAAPLSPGTNQHSAAQAGYPSSGFSPGTWPADGLPVNRAVGHLEPVNVKPVGVDPFGVEPSGQGSTSVAPQTAELIGAEPINLETIGVDYDDVEPLSVELDSGCGCTPTARYCSDCSQCRNRWGLLPKIFGQGHMGGWLQQGFTSNFGSPHDRRNDPVLFNDRSNDYRLNQLYFYGEKEVFPNRCEWDLGGRIDVLLGSDARFLTVPGLERHRDRTPKWNSDTDDYGIAIPQAYVEVASPWMGGVSVKAGHFYSIAGYETAAAPANFFYSHSYAFLYGEPFTHTGALLTSQPNDRLKLQAGYTTGWDNFDSRSDEYGILLGFTLTSADERTSLAGTLHTGDDVTSARVGGVLTDANRTFYSLVLQRQLSENWRYVFQQDFGYQEDGQIVVNPGPLTITTDAAKWYGINQYLIHDINDQLSSALRVEWFRDQDQSRLGIPVTFNPGGPTFTGGNYVAVTGGFNWRPHCNVTIRPELRWDYSDVKGNASAPGGDPNFRVFDDNTSSSQGTAALDVIVHY